MGLGKTLQSLCIIAGDHHKRTEEYRVSNASNLLVMACSILNPYSQQYYGIIIWLSDRLRECDLAFTARGVSFILYKLCRSQVNQMRCPSHLLWCARPLSQVTGIMRSRSSVTPMTSTPCNTLDLLQPDQGVCSPVSQLTWMPISDNSCAGCSCQCQTITSSLPLMTSSEMIQISSSKISARDSRGQGPKVRPLPVILEGVLQQLYI